MKPYEELVVTTAWGEVALKHLPEHIALPIRAAKLRKDGMFDRRYKSSAAAYEAFQAAEEWAMKRWEERGSS